MEWDEQVDDYVLRVVEPSPGNNGQRRGRR
jgi:hypothetical protein